MMKSSLQLGKSNAAEVYFNEYIICQKQGTESLISKVLGGLKVREAAVIKKTMIWIASIFLNQMSFLRATGPKAPVKRV